MQTLIPLFLLLTGLASAVVQAQPKDDWNLARLPGFSNGNGVAGGAEDRIPTAINQRQAKLDAASARQRRQTDAIQDKLRCDIQYRDTPTLRSRPAQGQVGSSVTGGPVVNLPPPIRTGPGC